MKSGYLGTIERPGITINIYKEGQKKFKASYVEKKIIEKVTPSKIGNGSYGFIFGLNLKAAFNASGVKDDILGKKCVDYLNNIYFSRIDEDCSIDY